MPGLGVCKVWQTDLMSSAGAATVGLPSHAIGCSACCGSEGAPPAADSDVLSRGPPHWSNAPKRIPGLLGTLPSAAQRRSG